METQRHVSLQIFLQHLFFFLSTTFPCPGNSLHRGGHCISMSHESSLKSSCPNVQLIPSIHSAVLRHMLFCILFQPCSHVGSKPWHQSSSCPYLFHFHRNVQNLARCLKKIQSFRQSNFCNCSRVGASCLLFSLT